MRHAIAAVCLGVLMCALPKPACAQSLTISANQLMFLLNQDPTPPQTLTITTTWQQASSDQLRVCLYMTEPMVGSPGNPTVISATSVQVNGIALGVGNGKPQCGVHGAQLISNTVVNGVGSRTDTPSVRLAGYPTTLEVDTYTGSINLVAIAY
ncbi:MAG TPA: hypothetical protein VD837_09210 [Terriglobales bacterium]|nr:hypothetical protein [Terriglobales bacterium]